MKSLRPRLTQALLSAPAAGARRIWADLTAPGAARRLTLYYQPGDPYSILCAQWLRKVLPRLNVPIAVRVVPPPDDEAYPQRQAQRAYAVADARRIAPAYGFEFPWAQAPDAAAEAQAAAALVGAAPVNEWLAREAEIADRLWAGESMDAPADPHAAETLQAHHAGRKRRGHYLGGMWWFRGEWFWGVDRLDFLEAALRAAGFVAGEAGLWSFDARRLALPAPQPRPSVEFFFSFRSPYSYLALPRLRELWERYRFQLQIKPVLPMVMRGLPVPAAKRWYIVRDVERVSRKLGLPFGRIADPLGGGVERCLALFPREAGSGAQLDYLQSAARAIWAEGIDVAGDDGLRKVCERAGMDWHEVEKRRLPPYDLAYAEANRVRLNALGAWGVPTVAADSLLLWGQDRLAVLEEWLQRGKTGRASAAVQLPDGGTYFADG